MTVFNVGAKKVFMKRGLTGLEVNNMDSMSMRAYRLWVMNRLTSQMKMTEDKRSGLQRISPTVRPQTKTRMLVSFYFHSSPIRGAIVQLLRDFMVEVVDLVRAWGYGAPTRPSYYDPEAVLVIVMKHDLQRHLAEAWDNGLTHPQKVAIDREVGLKASDRLTFALNHVPFIIDLGEQFATQLTLQGFAGLYKTSRATFRRTPGRR